MDSLPWPTGVRIKREFAAGQIKCSLCCYFRKLLYFRISHVDGGDGGGIPGDTQFLLKATFLPYTQERRFQSNGLKSHFLCFCAGDRM